MRPLAASRIPMAGTSSAPPGEPTSLALGAVTATTQALSWTAPASDGGSAILHYNVYLNGVFKASTPDATPSITVTGINGTIDNSYYVTAVNAIGEGSASNTVTQLAYAYYLFYDSFTGSGSLDAHTPEKGGAWTLGGVTTGTLSGGLATVSRAANNDALASNAGGATANGTYTFLFTYDPTLLIFKASVNYVSGNNRWTLEIVPPVGVFDLVEVTGGASAVRSSGTFAAGSSSATVVIVVNGDNIQATINGGTTANYTVGGRANKTATGIAVGAYSNTVNPSEVNVNLITQVP